MISLWLLLDWFWVFLSSSRFDPNQIYLKQAFFSFSIRLNIFFINNLSESCMLHTLSRLKILSVLRTLESKWDLIRSMSMGTTFFYINKKWKNMKMIPIWKVCGGREMEEARGNKNRVGKKYSTSYKYFKEWIERIKTLWVGYVFKFSGSFGKVFSLWNKTNIF